MNENNIKLPLKIMTPIQTSYQPDLDISLELKSEDGAYYQLLVGILIWMLELGRINICLEVSMIFIHLVLPQEGHLKQLYHVFAKLNTKNMSLYFIKVMKLLIKLSLNVKMGPQVSLVIPLVRRIYHQRCLLNLT